MLILSAILFLFLSALDVVEFRRHSTSKFLCTLWKTKIGISLRKDNARGSRVCKGFVLPKDDGRFDDAEEDLELKKVPSRDGDL
ncbi:hypothetical protein RIF29_33667 [Crotalaria pallida]|uniref:Secreted protein n=1 Tax=Crotalaria pallida TaxID=3830 RepID=A0AAN9EDW1_CROPI